MRALVRLWPLGLAFCLAGCQTLAQTRIAETKVVASVCTAFPAFTYSSKDTPETQLEAQAQNAARVAYGC